MRGQVAFVVFVLLAAGCQKSADKRLEGRWRGISASGVPTEQEAAAAAFATGTEMEFRDGMAFVKTPRDKVTSHYKVAQVDKTTVTITTDLDGPSAPQTFVFADSDTMRWTVTEGKTITFRREK